MATEEIQKRPYRQWNEVLNIEIACDYKIKVELCHEEPEDGFNGTSEPSRILITNGRSENVFISVDVWKLMQRAIKENWLY